MDDAEAVTRALAQVSSPADAVELQRFFKTGTGEYGEGSGEQLGPGRHLGGDGAGRLVVRPAARPRPRARRRWARPRSATPPSTWTRYRRLRRP